MADKNNKLPENVPGPWYVDNTCTPCRTCMEVAGADSIFKYNDGETYVFVHTQPAGDAVKVAEEAASVCPQNAIGNDGE